MNEEELVVTEVEEAPKPLTRKEKLAKRKTLYSLAKYLVSKAKYRAELLESREHDRQEKQAKASK